MVQGCLLNYFNPFIPSGWLSPSDDDQGYLAKIDQRVGDFTGLTMETAEQLQVCVCACVCVCARTHLDLPDFSYNSITLYVPTIFTMHPLCPSLRCVTMALEVTMSRTSTLPG